MEGDWEEFLSHSNGPISWLLVYACQLEAFYWCEEGKSAHIVGSILNFICWRQHFDPARIFVKQMWFRYHSGWHLLIKDGNVAFNSQRSISILQCVDFSSCCCTHTFPALVSSSWICSPYVFCPKSDISHNSPTPRLAAMCHNVAKVIKLKHWFRKAMSAVFIYYFNPKMSSNSGKTDPSET